MTGTGPKGRKRPRRASLQR